MEADCRVAERLNSSPVKRCFSDLRILLAVTHNVIKCVWLSGSVYRSPDDRPINTLRQAQPSVPTSLRPF